MSYVAAGIAGGGAVMSLGGAMMGASAASKAARAQQEAAAEWQRQLQKKEDTAVGLVKSPSQMAAFDQALHGQEANVRRQEALVASLDPNIIEAGKQTAQLLQGHSAPVLANLQQQRDLQKQQMLDQLTRQMGPGAAASTAGQQAIQQFDQQTANIMNSAQQSYLDKVSGMSMGGAQTLGQSLSAVHGTLADINSESPDVQAAKLMAQFAGPEGQAANEVTNAAGGQYKGQQLLGQALGQAGSGLMTAAAFSAAGRAGSSTPSAAPAGPADANQMSMGTGNATPQQMADYSAAQAPGGMAAAPTMARAAPHATLGQTFGSPARSNPASLPFSTGYGGTGNDSAYNMNPKNWQVGPGSFNYAGGDN